MKIAAATLALALTCCAPNLSHAQPKTPAALPQEEPGHALPPSFAPLLKREHPRLLASRAEFDALKARVQAEPWARETFARLRVDADKMLAQAPSKYEIPDGKRLLETSRRVLNRTYALGMAWKISGEGKYLERLWAELEASGNFKDWNPSHFLDTAEMTYAFAIAYDWCHEGWSPERRAFLKSAIVRHGLAPGVLAYRKAPEAKSYSWWTRVRHNWNQVCNGGLAVGALAILDEEPALGEEILHHAVANLPLAVEEYGPDGAWSEGPGYWSYATKYTVSAMAALDSALGQDFGLSAIKGFDKAGDFPFFTAGPNALTFNYADSGDKNVRAPELYWLARRFNRPEWAAYAGPDKAADARALLWYQPTNAAPKAAALDKYFSGTEVATMRTGLDAEAMFLGFKGGDNAANHSHLDLGTWVLDGLGERWVFNMGSDNYNLPGYFGKERWTYYRTRAEGHNTLIFNPNATPDQEPKAKAKITRFDSNPTRAIAIADLSTASPSATKHQRGWMLLRGAGGDAKAAQVLVQDEFELKQPGAAWWFAHTRAQVELADPRTAILSIGGKQMRARILSPANASWQVLEAKPLPTSPQPEKQGENGGVRKLSVQLENTRAGRIAVLFSPVGATGAEPEARALAAW